MIERSDWQSQTVNTPDNDHFACLSCHEETPKTCSSKRTFPGAVEELKFDNPMADTEVDSLIEKIAKMFTIPNQGIAMNSVHALSFTFLSVSAWLHRLACREKVNIRGGKVNIESKINRTISQ